MKTLKKVLDNNNVHDYESFKNSDYLKNEITTIKNNDIKKLFSCEYDETEHRIFIEKLIFKNKYINIEKLNLRDSKNISFTDCIFKCDIVISNATKIIFDNCIFMGYVSLQEISEFSMSSCNVNKLKIMDSEVELSICYTRIYRIELEDSSISTQCFFDNKIEYIELMDVDYKGAVIDSSQINLKNFDNIKNYLNNEADENFVFQSIISLQKDFIDIKKINNSIDFVLNSTDINLNKEMKNNLIYKKVYICNKSKLAKVLIKLTGGFSKPYIWIMYLLFTIILFSIIYLCPIFTYNIGNEIRSLNNFSEALYYSGITFTTIGYGDILPVGCVRALSILEGITGVCISSAFMVSVVKKYID